MADFEAQPDDIGDRFPQSEDIYVRHKRVRRPREFQPQPRVPCPMRKQLHNECTLADSCDGVCTVIELVFH